MTRYLEKLKTLFGEDFTNIYARKTGTAAKENITKDEMLAFIHANKDAFQTALAETGIPAVEADDYVILVVRTPSGRGFKISNITGDDTRIRVGVLVGEQWGSVFCSATFKPLFNEDAVYFVGGSYQVREYQGQDSYAINGYQILTLDEVAAYRPQQQAAEDEEFDTSDCFQKEYGEYEECDTCPKAEDCKPKPKPKKKAKKKTKK